MDADASPANDPDTDPAGAHHAGVQSVDRAITVLEILERRRNST